MFSLELFDVIGDFWVVYLGGDFGSLEDSLFVCLNGFCFV